MLLTHALCGGGAHEHKLFVHQVVLPVVPSITLLIWESQVGPKSDVLYPLVDILWMLLVVSEECLAGCHFGRIQTALSGWTFLSSGGVLVNYYGSSRQSEQTPARMLLDKLNSERSAGSGGLFCPSQSEMSFQNCCLCSESVSGESRATSGRACDPQPNKQTNKPYSKIELFCTRYCIFFTFVARHAHKMWNNICHLLFA